MDVELRDGMVIPSRAIIVLEGLVSAPGSRRARPSRGAGRGSPPGRPAIDPIVRVVEQKLSEQPGEVLAWQPIPLEFYTVKLPETIRSRWVFVLRANVATGAERHPNSHQRMMA
jgi:hypothetical protein